MSKQRASSRILGAMQVLLALAILASLAAGVFFLLRWSVTTILHLQSSVASVLVAGLLTLLTSLVVSGLNRYSEENRKERERLREAKRPVYEHLLGTIFGIFHKVRQSTETPVEDDPELIGHMQQIMENLVVWGSDDMVRIWGGWMRNANSVQSQSDPRIALLAMAQLMMSIRKELGHTKTNITHKELLSLFITDIDDFDIG